MPASRRPTRYKCEDCEWRGVRDDMNSIRDIEERVSPGECPECGALISIADDDIPDYVIDDAIRLALSRGLLACPNLAQMALALGLVADTSDNKIRVLTHDQLRNLITDLRDAAAASIPPIRAKRMTLVRSVDKRPVRFGDRIEGHHGRYVIQGGEPPRHSGSTGRVHTDQGVYFPSVVNCEWIAEQSEIAKRCSQSASAPSGPSNRPTSGTRDAEVQPNGKARLA